MPSESANSEGAELGRYLRARRTQTSPEHVGLTVGAGIRRTPGLRREELATLAGISIDYYVRLERGKETRPSPTALDSLARACTWTTRSTSTCMSSPPEPPATPPNGRPPRAGPCAPT